MASGLEYARAGHPRKGNAVRVNGGLARTSVGGETSASVSSEAAPTRRWSPEHSNGTRSAEAQGGVRTPFSGRSSVQKEERRSWDRGRKGHRILGRVPFRWKASRAVTSHRFSQGDGQGGLGGSLTDSVRATSATRARVKTREQRAVRGRGDRDVRGSIERTPWEENAHAHAASGNGKNVRNLSDLDPPKRSEWCETFGPPVKSRGAQTPRDAHVAKAAVASRERARCGCTQSRTDGRSRSDASSSPARLEVARPSGGLQQDTSRKEARSAV